MAASELIRSINPATEEVLAELRPATPDQVEAALSAAERTYARWRRAPFAERTRLMQRAAAHRTGWVRTCGPATSHGRVPWPES